MQSRSSMESYLASSGPGVEHPLLQAADCDTLSGGKIESPSCWSVKWLDALREPSPVRSLLLLRRTGSICRHYAFHSAGRSPVLCCQTERLI